jgi:hypothetical protein
VSSGGANHQTVLPRAEAPGASSTRHHPAHEQMMVLTVEPGRPRAMGARDGRTMAARAGCRAAKGCADAKDDSGQRHQARDRGDPSASPPQPEVAARLPNPAGGDEVGGLLVET